MEDYFKIKIGKCERKLPLIESEKISFYSFNMLGDSELNIEAAKEISKQLHDIDVIVTVESKAIALAQEVCHLLKMNRYVVIRKTKKSYMKNVVSVEGDTIISGKANYYMEESDVDYLKNKKICVLDDVISTCGTIKSISNMFTSCDLKISKFACILCEGKITKEYNGVPVVSCGFIPLMENENDR